MRAPYCGEFVKPRQCGVGSLGHVGHRKIVGEETIRQRAERQGHKERLCDCGRTHGAHPYQLFALCAGQAEKRLCQRQTQGQNQCQMADFWNHDGSLAKRSACCCAWAFLISASTPGGMYFESCLASTWLATNRPFLSSVP